MGKYFGIGLGLFALVMTLAGVNSATVEAVPKVIRPIDIRRIMNEKFGDGQDAKDAFSRGRYVYSIQAPPGRTVMQSFINSKFSSILGTIGGAENGHKLYPRTFQTAIISALGNKETQVAGLNLVAHLNQNEKDQTAEDQPLIILANYDTEVDITGKKANPTEDNGSGIAALLLLGEKLAADISSGALVLKHSVILAAVDASLLKYNTAEQLVPNATTGADDIAHGFLPEFLASRPKGIRGVIVLDNLQNFQELPGTQDTTGFQRAYPSAYAEISGGEFAGNFLALVARADDTDRPLVNTVASMWEATKSETKDDPEDNQEGQKSDPIQPRLIKFEHGLQGAQGEGYIHFLKSDQSSFWNHKSQLVKPYPAVLLTDTRGMRTAVCPEASSNCDNFVQTNAKKNLQFSHRTIMTVYQTIVEFQKGGAARLSGVLTFIPLLVMAFRYFNF